MTLLVTGGAGYIGSHTVLVLLQAGYTVVVVDNLCNAKTEALDRVQALTGRSLTFVQGDVRDRVTLDALFADHAIQAVIHFAGLKSVAESVQMPLEYMENNVAGSVTLCQAMAAAGVKRLVFSSSATVYGDEHPMPLHEALRCGEPSNPYGRSKLMVEQLLGDLARSDPDWSIACLRYFNPIGAHSSGRIGEDPQGTPNNLLPYIAQVAVGRRSELSVYGDDYATPDGTGLRDYIHVMDLAEGHLAALQALSSRRGLQIWNLGTGQAYSVLQVLSAFEQAAGKRLPYRICPRRDGDVASSWADPHRAAEDLRWAAKRGLQEMVADAWRWQHDNPNGYR
jgi:UDP-glucose 4-epimerase